MSNKNGIAKRETRDEIVVESATLRVVDSLVLRGDISALTSDERANYYIQLCESLGLNPASQPLAPLKLNGKEILYPTKGATDQLAAIHRITREIVDGPRLVDLGGTKLIYALCRATHPNGRAETATATVPFVDPVNVLMKCETKAKRRATLSILGLGMLDEFELETIPQSAKAPGLPVTLPQTAAGPAQSPRLRRLYDDLAQREDAPVEHAARCYVDARDEGAVDADTIDEAFAVCLAACPPGTSKAALQRAIASETPVRAHPTRPEVPVEERDFVAAATDDERPPVVDPPAATSTPAMAPALAAFADDVAAIELPGAGVGVWIKHRPMLARLDRADREGAWKLLCDRVGAAGAIKNAKVWLKKAIAVEDARRGAEDNDMRAAAARIDDDGPEDDGPRGGKRPAPANDATAAMGDAREATAAQGAQASAEWEAHLATKPNPFAVHASLAKRAAEFRAAGVLDARTRTAMLRVQALIGTTSEMVALAVLREPSRHYAGKAA